MPLSQAYDENLLPALMARGDKDAFTHIFNRYYEGLMWLARRFVTHEQAEEVVSESFVKLWQSAADFETTARMHGWLRVTVKNACLNVLRSQRNLNGKQEALLRLSDEGYEQVYFAAELSQDLYGRIVAEMEKLYPRQRQILRMFFLDELDNATIARTLGISVQAVKNQKVTALKTLRKVFSREDLLLCTCFLSLISCAFRG